MKQKTVPWDEATLSELKRFAASVLGITCAVNIGEATLRAKIRQAFPGDTITIMVHDGEDDVTQSDAPPPPSDQPHDPRALRGSSAVNDPKVTITIAEQEGAGGKRAVFVGVNGVGMLIPRGRPVDIPLRYYFALNDAVKTVHEQDEATGDVVSSEVPSYPMSINKMPPQADIDAYLAAEQGGVVRRAPDGKEIAQSVGVS